MTQRNIRMPQGAGYQVLLMTLILLAASVIGYFFGRIGFTDTNVVLIYLLAVLITTWLTNSFVFGLLTSVLALFLFNYFFAEPHYSFSVNDPNYMITFATMTVTASITSALTSHAKQSARMAREKEAETKTIYNLTNNLTGAKDIHDIASIAVTAISDCFSCQAACLCFDENGMPEPAFIQQGPGENQIWREVADEGHMKYQMQEAQDDFTAGAEFYDWPIRGSESILGVIRIPQKTAQAMKESQTRLLFSMVENTTLAMDRLRSAIQRMESREEIVKERYRTNLLRAISHDLRTPLSGIIGTSEMLMDMTRPDDPRYGLVRGIRKDADWLHSLVENTLNLTRLQDGRLALKKQPEAVEEVIGAALNHVARRSPDYDIKVSIPCDLLLVPMDAKLMEQVIINLLDNAIKHTKPEDEISILAEREGNADVVRFLVRDSGTGIREKDLPHIFQMFYTADGKQADGGYGIGLGLAICETIIKAHGGSIEAHNRADGQGAEFCFTLPMEEGDSEPIQ